MILSTLLFCIAEEVLSGGITSLVLDGKLRSMSSPRGYSTPSHILYADDVLVFCKGNKKGLDNLMQLFQLYGESSGQFLSIEKCRFYVSSITPRRSAAISRLLGFRVGQLPITYLGVPFFKGKPKKIYLQPIVDRIKNKLSSWKGSSLSIMGRVELVKSVIQGIASYSFHVYAWPISLLKQVDGWIRNFIWSRDINARIFT